MWLSGFSLENKGIHHKYQANTVNHRRVISLLKLAENVIRHSPLILNTLSLDAGLKVLQERYKHDNGLLNFLWIPQGKIISLLTHEHHRVAKQCDPA